MPVLIFVSREECPICQRFIRNEWEKTRKMLDPTVRTKRFHLRTPGQRIPYCLDRLIQWFPLFILCSDSEWKKCFPRDVGDEIRPELSTGYIPDVLVFNGWKKEGSKKWELVDESTRKKYSFENIVEFGRMVPPFKLSVRYLSREKRW